MGRPSKRADWEGIKRDYLNGMALNALASKWKVGVGTISSRATRQEWPSASRIQRGVEKVAQMAHEAAEAGLRSAVEDPNSPTGLALSSLQTQPSLHSGMDALQYQAIVAEFATKAMQNGMKTAKKPANWRELAVVDSIARRALGLDGKGGASAATMVRVTSQNGDVVDIAAVAQADGGADSGGDWDE